MVARQWLKDQSLSLQSDSYSTFYVVLITGMKSELSISASILFNNAVKPMSPETRIDRLFIPLSTHILHCPSRQTLSGGLRKSCHPLGLHDFTCNVGQAVNKSCPYVTLLILCPHTPNPTGMESDTTGVFMTSVL